MADPQNGEMADRVSKSERLPKSDRILVRREFLRIQQAGRKVQTRHLIGLYLPSSRNRRRLGIVVSGKIGNSVARNRIKRWLREIFRKENARLPEQIDLVLIAKKGAIEAGYQRLRDEFLEATQKVREGRTRS